MLSFDIETAPLPGVLESKFAPVYKQPEYKPFEPEKVKRLKSDDDESYRAKYLEAEEAHQLKRAKELQDSLADHEQAKERFLDEACLYPHLGRVLCIGLLKDDKFVALEGDEKSIIERFLGQYRNCVKYQWPIVSHGGQNFDWPFIIRRCWALGIRVPGDLVIPSGKFWNWNQLLRDTGQLWLLGQYPRDTRWSIDVVGHCLGTGGKTVEGVSGKGWWRTYETNRELALQYLENDCRQCMEIYNRICPPTV